MYGIRDFQVLYTGDNTRKPQVLHTQGGNANGSQVVRLLPRSRLLHSPSMVTAWMSVGYGPWPPYGWCFRLYDWLVQK